MKYAKRLAIAAVALATLFVGIAPGDAATATNLTVSGTMTTAGLQPGATMTVVGGAWGATAGTQPSANAGASSMSLRGDVQGSCLSWSALVSGRISPSLDPLGNGPTYTVHMAVNMVGRALRFTGTAVDASGSFKIVEGHGVAMENWNASPTCSDVLATSYIWNGTLAIVG